MPDTRKTLTYRLSPEEWAKFRKYLIDQNLTGQEWFTAQVQQALGKEEK